MKTSNGSRKKAENCPKGNDWETDHLKNALDKGSMQAFLPALRDVVMAHGGMTALSRETNLSRESLYKMLSPTGNPEMKSLWSLLRALDLKLCVVRNGGSKR